jgi:SPP1 family predicted phage head-tail adaptor
MWGIKVELGNWVESIVSGEPIRTITWTKVWADKQSVRQSEHYAAANVGLRPEVVFVVHSSEFNGHEMVRHDGKEYSILRRFDKDGLTELVCGAAVGNG